MTIEIEKREIHASQEAVFTFLADLNNYTELMPDTVTHWEVEGDKGTIQMQMIPKITMEIVKREPNSRILIKGGGPFDFTLTIQTEAKGADRSISGMLFEADINPFMKMMIEKPMGSFFGYMVKRVQEKFA